MIRYRHTQVGWTIIMSVDLTAALIVVLLSLKGFNWIPLTVLFVLGGCTFLFASLTVAIDEEYLHARFGPGLIRKSIPLRLITAYQPVRSHWYEGWGIRQISKGWMYNVSGFDAVELQMQNGRRYRIGTNDPEGLIKALHQALGR